MSSVHAHTNTTRHAQMHRCDYSALYEHLYVLPRKARSAQAVRHCCNRPSSTGMWCASRPASTTVSESPAATSLGTRMGQRRAFSALESASAILEPCHTAAGGMPVQVACVSASVLIYPSIHPSIHLSIHPSVEWVVCMCACLRVCLRAAHVRISMRAYMCVTQVYRHTNTRTHTNARARTHEPTNALNARGRRTERPTDRTDSPMRRGAPLPTRTCAWWHVKKIAGSTGLATKLHTCTGRSPK